MLSPEELDACVQRLEVVQAHLSQLKADGLLIDDNDWDSEKVGPALNSDNSYAHRHHCHALRRDEKNH
jgi:hypothetical protein